MEWADGRGDDGGGEIIEVDPPRRLVHTWGVNGAEHKSRVTYDIEPVNDVVKLTITHDNLTADELADIAQGWPIVLASLKSYLETGTPLSSLVSQDARDDTRRGDGSTRLTTTVTASTAVLGNERHSGTGEEHRKDDGEPWELVRPRQRRAAGLRRPADPGNQRSGGGQATELPRRR